MTFEELKAEAEKHGYRLVKKLILLPCPICGKVPTLWLNANGLKSYACVTCDKTGWAARTEEEAIELWNYHAERREVAKAAGTEPSHTVGGWTIEGEGEE